MSNRLSYSQARKYNECGQKFKFHYVDGYRETTISSALLFGSAFDKATEAKLKNLECDEYAVFDSAWLNCTINGTTHEAPMCTLINYFKSDFDIELLSSDDIKFLQAKCEELYKDKFDYKNNLAAFYESLIYLSVDDENAHKLKNLFNWMSLRRKGILMLDANRTKVLPRIKKIIDSQRAGELTNDAGDTTISFLDLQCVWEDDTECIMDYKTAAKPYPANAVAVSDQLSIYGYTHGIKRGGYFVFLKTINKNRKKVCSTCEYDGSGKTHKTCNNEVEGKRCNGEWTVTINPECDVQILVDNLTETFTDHVIENLNDVNDNITAGVFEKNEDSCFSYGRPCEFLKLCRYGDNSNLYKKEK